MKRGSLIGRVGLFSASGGRAHLHFELCLGVCPSGHADGDLEGTEDPMDYDAGCFRADRDYADDRLVLTRPIACR